MYELLVHRLKTEEGYSSKLYRDTSDKVGFEGKKGKVTIGWGYNIDDRGLPEDICEELFRRTLNESVREVEKNIPWSENLDAARREVLVEMAFNQGITSLLTFKGTLGALQRGQYAEAAGHLRDSLAYRQLPKRYEALAQTLEKGV